MVRKIATQIPSAVGRLIKSKAITPPAWYAPVLAHLPTPLPPRPLGDFQSSLHQSQPSASSSSSSQPKKYSRLVKHSRAKKYRPREIVYEEDAIRQRFFRDFPFEALRATSLVEGRQVVEETGVTGEEWVSLSQRGDYPSVENTIQYILNLHSAHDLSLAEAYVRATREFSTLRAKHELATFAAEEEAKVVGRGQKEAVGGKDVFKRFFDLETKALNTNLPASSLTSSSTSDISRNPPSSMTRRRNWTGVIPVETRAAINKVSANGREALPFSGGLGYTAGWIGELYKREAPKAAEAGAGAGVPEETLEKIVKEIEGLDVEVSPEVMEIEKVLSEAKA